jgi:hypothetical protein
MSEMTEDRIVVEHGMPVRYKYMDDGTFARVIATDIEHMDVSIGGVTIADGADVNAGATTDIAVTTDVAGTLSAKLRGLIKLILAKINIKIADGDDATLGAKADVAITDSTTSNTLMSFVKGLMKIWDDVWNPTTHNLQVTVSNPTTNPETGLAKDGTDIATPTAMPAGGVGIRGWLSAIFTKLNGSMIVNLITGFAVESGGNLAGVKTNTDRLLGQNGGVIIPDTNAHTGLSCFAIKAQGVDVVINTMTLAAGWTGSMAAVTIKAGDVCHVGFTAVTLTSGTAMLYNN